MNYYIDGDFEIKDELKTNANLYSSTYSTKNRNYANIVLDPELQNNIYHTAFDEIVEFYNRNSKHFLEFKDELGIDIWFFENFRINFAYRDFLLKIQSIRKFLTDFEDGKVISNDRRIAYFIDPINIQFSDQKNTRKVDHSLKSEFFYILQQFKFSYKQKNDLLILSRHDDNIKGKDKRFGDLDNEVDKLINRDQFNLSLSLPKRKFDFDYNGSVDGLLANYLVGFKWFFELRKFKKKLAELIKQLSETNNNEDPKSKLIIDLFEAGKNSFSVYYLRYKALARFFRKTNYKGVFLINENAAQQKALLYAAHENKVKTYAVQHGAIYGLHPAFMFGKYESKPLVANKTFTWGKHYTDLLINKGGYKQEQVVTSGKIKPIHSSVIIHPEFKSDKIKILYATQPQPDETLRRRELTDVLKVMSELIDTHQLIIRPHPAEKEDQYFLNIGIEIGFTNFLIDRVTDLESHLAGCDALITSYSTVGAELIPHYKPLLVLDYLKADRVSYIEQNVGIPIRDASDLKNVLIQEKIEINKSAYDDFNENYFFRSGKDAISIVKNSI